MAFTRSKIYTLEAAQAAIQRYCAFQERCQSEVEERLRSMGVLPEAQAELVADLMANGFLNEERFARAFARGKFRIKGWGPRKIAQGLQAKRVSSACINLGLSELDEGEVRGYLLRQREKYPDDQEFLAWAYRRGFDRSSALQALQEG
jgi:regulatory protein